MRFNKFLYFFNRFNRHILHFHHLAFATFLLVRLSLLILWFLLRHGQRERAYTLTPRPCEDTLEVPAPRLLVVALQFRAALSEELHQFFVSVLVGHHDGRDAFFALVVHLRTGFG